jgi:hypothetical protein
MAIVRMTAADADVMVALTTSPPVPHRIPIKLEESNRGCPDPREGAAVRFHSSPLGGCPIGRTPDSGLSVTLGFAILFNDLR